MPAKNHPKSLETARAPARNRVGGHHSKFRVMQRYIGAFSPSSLLPRVHSSSPRWVISMMVYTGGHTQSLRVNLKAFYQPPHSRIRETGRGGGRLGVFAEGLDSTSNTQFSDNTEKWVYEDDQIEAGSILLWEPPSSEQGQDQGTKTEGDYFKHTAVLLVEHSDTVTTGFVLNQPSMHTVEEAVAINTLPAIFKESPVFVGGPIGSSLEIIHRIPNVKNSTTIADGIYYGGDINHAASLIQKGEADLESVRFMYRFAGWYPGQLSEEIAAGCWRVVKASPSWIFDKLPRHLVTPLARPEVWARMMSKVGDERVSRDEVASLTNPKTVDMWVSALTKPNPEAGACVIAAIAKYSENLSSKRGSDNGSGDDEEGEEEGRSEDSEKDGNASLLSQEEVLQEVEEDVERRLDAIQREVMWTLAASRSDPSAGIPGIEARLSALNGVLYNGLKMGLPMNEKTAAEAMGASMVLYQSEHYFIDHALESLAADPFLLSVIYMALGRRVGVDLLPVYLTQLPTRILLRLVFVLGLMRWEDCWKQVDVLKSR
eukprot:jgi/Bigna1/73803/fgenesh1_pg.26_\